MSARTVLAAVVAVLAGTGAVARATTADDAAAPAGPVDGATLFRLKGCASCHDGPDSRSVVDVGPPLAGAASWAGTRRPGLDAEAYLRESIRTPGAFVAAGSTFGMPVLTMTDDEVDRLVAYLLAR